ncbi:MAG: DUF2723 domain-containing protein [Ignavibacteriales bacterium]|nr:DUF2723 domain-containing protein [Ignavibacteriales bacterium]
MDFKLINRITAGVVFLISFFVLLATVQPSVSFWDCGEFIAASYSLQVPHPPGAPFFLLLGRFFSMIPFAENIGFRVNMVSVISSALSILFLYLIIVKVIENYRGKVAKNMFGTVSTVIAAAVGALSFSFSDTFWFNGAEAEVYAASTVIYAAIMYFIMLWNERSEEPGSEKYLLLICYLIGLSTGIHLMSVLAMIPVVMIVVFKKYLNNEEEYDTSVKYFLIHVGVILLVASGLWLNETSIEPPTPEIYKSFDGTFKVMLVLISAVIMGVFYKKLLTRNSIYFSLIIGGIALGLTYPGVVKILPSIMSTIGGQTLAGELAFIAVFLGIFGWIVYYGHKNNKATLHLVGLAAIFIFLGFTTYTQVIIRSNAQPPMNENEPDTFPELVKYLNREQYGDFPTFKRRFSGEPHQAGVFSNYSSDLHFLYTYQMNHMMTRYLLWNYAGRESWDQDAGSNIAPFNGVGEVLGKPFGLDFKGNVQDSLFGIPFILGLIGIFLHFRRDKKMAMVYMVLFLFMGYLTSYYQNQQQPQPRERDYFYVGAFFVYSLWIGISVKEIAQLIYEKLKENSLGTVLGYAFLLFGIFFVPVRMYAANLYTHDRSNNWIPWDYAYNLLQSCAPNAILFTNGDNDTFPLWYLQDVEGVRRDVRIANLSLANTEWYIKQLKNLEPYGSAKVAMKFSDEEIERLRPTLYTAKEYTIQVPQEVYTPLSMGLDSVKYSPSLKWVPDLPKIEDGRTYARVQDFVVMQIIENNNWQRPVYFSTTCSDDTKIGLQKFLYLEGMAFRLMPFEIPAGKDGVNEKVLWKQVMEEPEGYSKEYKAGFKFRGLADSSIFLDENHKRMTLNYRNAYLRLSNYYMIEKKDNATALKVLNTMEKKMPLARTGLDYRYRADLANLYRRLGDLETYKKMMAELEPEALSIIRDNPQILSMDVSTVTILLDYYETVKKAENALVLVDLLEKYYPGNPDVQAQRDKFNAILTGKVPADTAKKDTAKK